MRPTSLDHIMQEAWRKLLIPDTGYEISDLWQVLLVLLVLLLSAKFVPRTQKGEDKVYNVGLWFREQRSFIVFWVAVLVLHVGFELLTPLETSVFQLFNYLGAAWFLIGFVTSFIKNRFWAESWAAVFYLLTAYSILALAGPAVEFLDELRFGVGTFSISAWQVLAGLFTILFALWMSLAIARLVERQVQRVPRMSGSLKVLISKVARILILVVAGMMALNAMGIDLSALTVMGGAIGLGLGFGLQKVVSNFISGIILLMDNSIKPGDVIEIEGTYGWINNLRARYASIITRDGTEHLIPNEDLITQKVTNWSFTDNLVRQRIPIGVSYGADPHQCIEIVLEAARSIDRILKEPAPACLLTGFGDSSVDLELRIWIADPANGVANVKSAALLAVWDAFKANGIEIPFPQRDLHIRSSHVDFVKREEPDPE
ncbi:mechanosensitive ion channel protein [Coraliomargarita sinensis]|uniref:Mechanosensitive ion channel protein n=1 Tax=Coraliomargarita sinensis TaxID=2174842 RepID=A0A317ZEM8_9BACT|nr:mechanosensitive ion channel domain-containing protein [Coraliomargarita sinensis]PXA03222.1 mechanosensitive ion channel protein [Coraliomargarita sinensis]